MFVITRKELNNLTSQVVTLSYWGIRYLPYAFTEQGVAMLSSILKVKKSIDVNIAIMRTFVQLRKYSIAHKEIFSFFKKVRKSGERMIIYLVETGMRPVSTNE
jgi:hypothetical protein